MQARRGRLGLASTAVAKQRIKAVEGGSCSRDGRGPALDPPPTSRLLGPAVAQHPGASMVPLEADLAPDSCLEGREGGGCRGPTNLGGCDWSGRGWRWVRAIISGGPTPPPPQPLFLAAARVRRLCRHDGTCPADVRAHRRARGPARVRRGAAQRHVSFVRFPGSFGARGGAHAPALASRWETSPSRDCYATNPRLLLLLCRNSRA